jgi:hypothetical protein
MGFKPSPEEQKWAKIVDIDTKKRMKEDFGEKSKYFIPEILPVECPNDRILLETLELDNTGIIINKCSFCGGIWIDRITVERLFHSSKKAEVLLIYLAKILNIEISEI